MITEGFVVCTNVSQENDIEYDLLKSINDIIFKEIVEWTRDPSSLRIELNKLGVWYFKKSKTELKKNSLIKGLISRTERTDEEDVTNRIKNYEFILSEYEKFNKDKYDIKCLKYGKENYEAYCLAKKQEKIQKTKETKSI